MVEAQPKLLAKTVALLHVNPVPELRELPGHWNCEPNHTQESVIV